MDVNDLNRIVALKREIADREEELKILADALKAEAKDGIIGVGPSAIVLYTQERLNATRFAKAYPYPVHATLYKNAPDTAEIHKALSGDEFSAVADKIRGLKVTTLADALADEAKFKKD